MKRKLFSTLLCAFALLLLMGAGVEQDSAAAAIVIEEESASADGSAQVLETGIQTGIEAQDTEEISADEIYLEAINSDGTQTSVTAEPAVALDHTLLVNGQPVPADTGKTVEQGTTYVALAAMAQTLDPSVTITWDGGSSTAAVQSAVLDLTAKVGQQYLVANGRYLYVPEGVRMEAGRVVVPLKELVKAFDAKLSWDPADWTTSITTGSGGIASGAILGPIIPPSTNFILLGATVGLSITKLFMIGLVPGLIIGLCLMVTWFFIVRIDGYKEKIEFKKGEASKIVRDAMPAFMMPVLLLGGIRFGVFTPTEGGAFACVYAIAVCTLYYRELTFKGLLAVSARAARTTSVVMLIVATATAVGWFITSAQIPMQVAELFQPLVDSPILLLLSINVFLFLAGMVMDLTPNVLIFAPVFYPLIQQAGIDPYFFGLLFILNLGIGVITPPVGTVLYVVCGIGNIKIGNLVRNMAPFLIVEMLVLFLLLFFPSLSIEPMKFLMK